MASVEEILTFWFGLPGEPSYGKPRACWFRKKNKFDQEVRDRFLDVYQQAATGNLDSWYASSHSCLALILLLDQFSRNMFRGTAQAFATDSQAIAAAEHAITMGFDLELITVQRWFIYLPFEHSENLAHQRRSVELFSNLSKNSYPATTLDAAIQHLAIIERFGRFPHRNKILGRTTTPEEAEFLKQKGSSF